MTIIALKKINIPPLGVHLIIEVEVNGVPTKLVLDTGASRSVIDREYLSTIDDSLELKEEPSLSAGVGASNLESFTVILESLKIGALTIEDCEIAVMDLTHVKASYEQIEEDAIYGVIGGDLLLDYNAIIDYANLKLKLTD